MNFNTCIDAASLNQLLGSPGLVVLDCRFDLAAPEAGSRAYLRQHIPTARYADLNRDLSSPVTATSGRHPLPDPRRIAARFGELGIDQRTQVVAYDEAGGAIAARAWWLLRWLGHRTAAVLDGGFKAWLDSGLRLETGEPAATPPRRFTAKVEPTAVLTTAELIEALEDPQRLLLDARAAERYAGTVEPLDAVAGHVPGALNHPFSLNLGANGHFLPPAELRRRFRLRLGDIAPENVILMCGSGVTACHDLLAMEIAGLRGAKLYAGSWSEWIRDPKRPVARGN